MSRTNTARDRRIAARLQETAEFKQRMDAAKAHCDSITDLEDLADAARTYLLAYADWLEVKYGSREKERIALERRRANSESYRLALAAYWIGDRLKKAADATHDLTPQETKDRDARIAAESRAFMVGINALIRSMTAAARAG